MNTNQAPGGYAGTILTIDLSTRSIQKTPLQLDMARSFIGGSGINARLIYDLIKPGTDPLSPENVLIFGAGPLIGTMTPTAARTSVMAKSPLSGLLGISNAGHFGAMLKFAGYDHLIIKGKANEPVYLKIEDDDVQIRSARHLAGKDVFDTVDALWNELGSDYVVSCIGPAGENLVRFASIICNKYSTFGRTGLGAVMGSKNLKAIAVNGTKGIGIANRRRFMKLVDQVIDKIMADPNEVQEWRKHGTHVFVVSPKSLLMRRRPRRDTEALDANKFLEAFRISNIACHACPLGCKAWLELQSGKNRGLSFAVSCTAGTVAGPYGLTLSIQKYEDIASTAVLGQRYGIDSIETSGLIYWVIELYERGIINKNDTSGLELEWGNTETIQELMRQITYREGFGGILADGIVRAIAVIGKGSDLYGAQIKGLTFFPEVAADIRANLSSSTFGYLVNPRGWHHDTFRFPPMVVAYESANAAEVAKKYSRHIGVPQEAQDQIITGEGYNLARFAKYVEEYNLVVWSLGLCDRYPICRSMDIDTLADLYSSATGIETSKAELLKAAERTWNLMRMFNVREGASRRQDAIPRRLLVEPLTSFERIYPSLNADQIDALLDDYYQEVGWEPETGIPTAAKLRELGLEDVTSDRQRVG